MTNDSLLAAGSACALEHQHGAKLVPHDTSKEQTGPRIVLLGGGRTCSRGAGEAYPALLEAEMGGSCISFGFPNASIDAFTGNIDAVERCRNAEVSVVEVLGAANLSNRLYKVHPRRNDRFLDASPALRVIYPQVNFTAICFTRHLLERLHQTDHERFEVVRQELQIAWTARMTNFLDHIGSPTILLWLSPPRATKNSGPLGCDPLFVTAEMVEALRDKVHAIVALPISEEAASARSLDSATHSQIATLLIPSLREAIKARHRRLRPLKFTDAEF